MNLYISACSNDDYPSENFEAFLLELDNQIIQELTKLKQKAEELEKSVVGFENFSVANFLNGDFVDKIDNQSAKALLKQTYTPTTNTLKDYKNIEDLENKEITISPEGFWISAYEKHTGVKWFSLELEWSVILDY